VTTAKDLVRLPAETRAAITAVNVDLEFDDPVSLSAMLRDTLSRRKAGAGNRAHG
jgi:tetraacyldisaccharide-1-P 4'-kinase